MRLMEAVTEIALAPSGPNKQRQSGRMLSEKWTEGWKKRAAVRCSCKIYTLHIVQWHDDHQKYYYYDYLEVYYFLYWLRLHVCTVPCNFLKETTFRQSSVLFCTLNKLQYEWFLCCKSVVKCTLPKIDMFKILLQYNINMLSFLRVHIQIVFVVSVL